ncbi:MAG: hypothetical protein II710_05675 [Clostridia bacterium]|nr:hypothetical protein [Clostridia bacterium]
MKKRLSIIVGSFLILLSLASCQKESVPYAPGSHTKQALDGKKVVFVGCSYTYYGNVVHRGSMEQDSQNYFRNQKERMNDQAFFYQLCKANGAEVNVTDWCYGGHDLTDLFDGSCNADRGCNKHDHLKDLEDRFYDHVILQDILVPGQKTAEDYLENARNAMAVFREANPDVRFYYVVHDGVYTQNYPDYWKNAVELIQKEGVTIIDWGTLVWDIWNGNVSVPGAELPYNKQSFIVSQTSLDGYHPNPLSGYLYSLMTYCAITGETAVGQPYAFCTADTDILKLFISRRYIKDNLKTPENEKETNFIEILSSAPDMKGLQTLANQYMH